MVAFGHTAVGVITGLAVYQFTPDTNPAIGLVAAGSAGVISHYITDFIPHGHFFKFGEFKNKIIYAIIFDLLFSLILFLSLSYYKFGLSLPFWYILFAIGGAQLPDVIDSLRYTGTLKLGGPFEWEAKFHVSTHWHGKFHKALLIGKRDLWQVIVVLLAAALLLKY